jgi:hypothetical protein
MMRKLIGGPVRHFAPDQCRSERKAAFNSLLIP